MDKIEYTATAFRTREYIYWPYTLSKICSPNCEIDTLKTQSVHFRPLSVVSRREPRPTLWPETEEQWRRWRQTRHSEDFCRPTQEGAFALVSLCRHAPDKVKICETITSTVLSSFPRHRLLKVRVVLGFYRCAVRVVRHIMKFFRWDASRKHPRD